MAVNGARPGWFTLPTWYGERIRRQPYQVGIELKRVLFADHRSGWSGLRLYVYCLWWSWGWTVACWRNGPPDAPQDVVTLRQQVEATHGDRWAVRPPKGSSNHWFSRSAAETSQFKSTLSRHNK